MNTAEQGQLMLSIGALLASEREKRGIPVEKAAKETRMRPQRIRDMERDDLSHFTNPSYARMFIIAYAKYLGIPMRTISEHLPDRGESATDGYQYISMSTEELPSLRHDLASKPAKRNNTLYTLAIVTLLVLLCGVGGLGYYLAVNAPRLTNSVDKPQQPDPTPPPPQVVVVKSVILNNVQPDGSSLAPFDGHMQMGTAAQGAAAAPAAPAKPAAAPDDHAFLLGSSPDVKPANVQ